MTNRVIRYATAADIVDFYKGPAAKTIRAMVLEVDGKVILLGGVAYMANYNLAFMEMTPAANDHPVALMKATRKVINEIYSTVGQPLIAERDEELATSQRFLERIGFVHLRDDLYIWKGVA